MRVMIANIPATILSMSWNSSILQSPSDIIQRTHTPFHVLPSSNRPNLFSGD
jgi:hypothetical protein